MLLDSIFVPLHVMRLSHAAKMFIVVGYEMLQCIEYFFFFLYGIMQFSASTSAVMNSEHTSVNKP